MFYFYKGDKVKMKVVFVSNYYNHHQAPFSQAMSRLTNGKFWFCLLYTSDAADEL